MKLAALVLVWLSAVDGAGAVAGLPGDGPPRGPGLPDAPALELPDSSPAIRCPLAPEADQGAITAVAYSRDGKSLIAGNMNGVLQWFDAESGRRTSIRRVIPGHVSGVNALALSPDGRSLALLTDIGQVSLLDAATGAPILALEQFPSDRTYPEVLLFSPDGKTLAGALTSGEILLWDAATGRRRAILPAHIVPEHPVSEPSVRKMQQAGAAHVSSLAFAPDGRSLVSESQLVRTWDVAAGREVGRLEGSALLETYGQATLSPDGSLLAVSHRLWDDLRSNNPGRITLYDRATGRQVAELATPGQPDDMKFLPDGKTLVTLGPGPLVRLWDVGTARPVAAIKLHEHNAVDRLAVSPDGKRIALGGHESVHLFGIIYQFETDGSSLKLRKPQP